MFVFCCLINTNFNVNLDYFVVSSFEKFVPIKATETTIDSCQVH